MKVRIDHPLFGWSAEVDLPAIPAEGTRLTLNEVGERIIGAVIWHVSEYRDPWVQIIMQPSSDDIYEYTNDVVSTRLAHTEHNRKEG